MNSKRNEECIDFYLFPIYLFIYLFVAADCMDWLE